MKKKIIIPIICVVLVVAIVLPIILTTTGGQKKDAIVIMTEETSDLFSPFYATSGPDQDVVGMTQIGMLTSKYNKTTGETEIVAGKDQATVAEAYDISSDGLTYTFVLKNDMKFSDGYPLTMNDVMFNLYEYLDPVYTGSSTMYSTKIKGLSAYRTKNNSDENAESVIESNARGKARDRIAELEALYREAAYNEEDVKIGASETKVKTTIKTWEVGSGYKNAVVSSDEVASTSDDKYRAMLEADYNYILETYKKELVDDYRAAKESFDLTTETSAYAKWADADHFGSDIFKFLYFEGLITPKYKKVQGKDDKSVIEGFENADLAKRFDSQEKAINHVYNSNVENNFDAILSASATYGVALTQFTAEAKSIILKDAADQNLDRFNNISGIVSLGHTTDVESVSVKGNTYKVAHEYNADGTVKNSGEYAVLQITLDEADPKAIYNFSFSVSPFHYYAAATLDNYLNKDYSFTDKNGNKVTVEVDIKNNKFGVAWGSSEFQSKVIQSAKNVSVPMGAGIYCATDSSDNNIEKVTANGFKNSGIVYFKKNDNFVFPVKHDKMRMQVVSSSGALDVLSRGKVDYVTPQLTKENYDQVDGDLSKKGFSYSKADQLGYGYIGINAGKVQNVNIRRAIMSSMETGLATEYYSKGTCSTIYWPMSLVSWAYPRMTGASQAPITNNGHDYAMWTTKERAIENIKKYTDLAIQELGSSYSPEMLKITFTIAGASITEHPTYAVFKQAAELLNDLEGYDWQVEVKADSQALTKLSTGSLAVWAAAWGATIDPDMYQVYHINSSATSTYSWGYREIKDNQTLYSYEYGIISGDLKDKIEEGRKTSDRNTRKNIYKEAMSYVLDLAVELPVYQRQNLYAYNTKTVKGFNQDVNAYESPLNEMWNLELVK